MNLCDTCTHVNCPASRKDVEITSDADIIKCNKYLSFLDKMKDTTIEEQQGINTYVDSISHNTGINFFDYLD